MSFSHVFISRPLHEAEELAAMLAPLGLETIVQPAFDYHPVDARAEAPGAFAELEDAQRSDLVVFTSTRAVNLGLPQLPREVLWRARVAAIGPATARALMASGIRVGVMSPEGYTSEALLKTLAGEKKPAPGSRGAAFIIAAPGGRQALADGADIIETDLHLTAEGIFVCIHDATVDRTTDGSGPGLSVAGVTSGAAVPAAVSNHRG